MQAPIQAADARRQAGPTAAAEALPVWRNGSFMRLLTGYTVSVFGDSFNGIAISLWVLQTTGSAQRMAAVQICYLSVGFLFGSFAGTIADRFDRRRLMLFSELSRSAIAAILAVSLFVLHAPFPTLLVLASLSMFCSLLLSPAFHASTTAIVGPARVQQAASAIHIADNAARISGLAVAGIVVSAFGGLAAILTTAAAFLFSAVCTLLTRGFPRVERATAEHKPSFLEDWRGGLAYMRRDALIRSIVLLSPLLSAFFLSAIMLVQVIAVGKWRANPIEFGLLEMCIPLGYLAGAGIILGFGRRLGRRGRLVFAGLLPLGPLYAVVAFISSPLLALPLILLGGLLFAFCSMMVQIILKTEVRGELQGRIYGTLGAITSVAPTLSLAAVSMLADRWGAGHVLAVLGMVLLVLGIVAAALLKPIRTYR
ncbi:MFS transporter [Cohnella hashimotonis]|uniref:MFS transporter n=1 Tax=Cohnella hashimotonis TaxID=2826895 RepID=A0ABT6TQG8_9BACL|nr:MFS transporter [Cohnella hashimotonis]MDI4648174.1 MFS transporter [Cohnella hashimotonis]